VKALSLRLQVRLGKVRGLNGVTERRRFLQDINIEAFQFCGTLDNSWKAQDFSCNKAKIMGMGRWLRDSMEN